MSGHISVIAVVVTYNRKELLVECIRSILSQTYQVEKVIVVNNCSTDGTLQYIKESGLLESDLVDVITLDENKGCSGGFHYGMKYAQQYNYDWIWLMDDDTIAYPDSLINLIDSLGYFKNEEYPSFLSSRVENIRGCGANIQTIDYDPNNNGEYDCYDKLKYGLIKIKEASFVSLLISKRGIDKVGFPCKDYFIWGDDYEYTNRLSKHVSAAFLCGSSVVLHKRQGSEKLSILYEDNPNRIRNYYYYYRNMYWTNRKYYGNKGKVKSLYRSLKAVKDCFLCRNINRRLLKTHMICKGTLDGVFTKMKDESL